LVDWKERPGAPAGDRTDATPNIFVLFSPKGGVGKTTLAVNLAVTIAGRGVRLLLIDGSLQFGSVASALDTAERFNNATLEAYLGGAEWEVVRRSLVTVTVGG